MGGHTAAVVTVAAFDIGDPDLPRRVADDAARIEAECGMRPLGELYADPRIDFADVEPALRALRDAGAEIEFRFPPPEGELPESIPPPPPEPWPGNALTGFRCACRPDVIALDLPIADMGEQEQGQEEDDRIVVQLQRGGVFFKRSLHLDEFAEALRAVKERYDLKMRQQGKAGFEKLPDGTLLSKVYVLIRADRAASAQHVGFLLHVLAEEGFYKVQFAVAGEPLEDPGPCVGVPRSKIQVFLPTDGVKGIGGADEPSVHVYVDQGSFSVGSVAGLCEGLCRAVGEARAEPGRKLVVGVHVAAGVTWGQVIEAVNEIARAGAQKIVFVDLPPPDEMTRRMNPLPR